jgi:hypothetical protein
MVVYNFNTLAQDDVATKVQWLLEDDRFICEGQGREVRSLDALGRISKYCRHLFTPDIATPI